MGEEPSPGDRFRPLAKVDAPGHPEIGTGAGPAERRARVRTRLTFIATGVTAALVAGAGCGAGTAPEALFTEAERLRLMYEKDASHEAIARYREAMASWQRQGNGADAARAGQGLGATHEQLGRLHEALKGYQAALSLARESADRVLESETRSDVGRAQALVADREDTYVRAREQCQRALELARLSGSERAEATALNCLGEVAYLEFHLEEALERYRASWEVWHRIGDRSGQAQTLLYQGYVF